MVGLIWGMLPHGSENGNFTEPPIRDSSLIGKALQREGILLLNALNIGSSPVYLANTTWTPQVDSVSGIVVWVLGSP